MKLVRIIGALLILLCMSVAIEIATYGNSMPVRTSLLSSEQGSNSISNSDFSGTLTDAVYVLRVETDAPVFGGNAILSAQLLEGRLTVMTADKVRVFDATDKPKSIKVLIPTQSDQQPLIYLTSYEGKVKLSNLAVSNLSRHQTIWPTSINLLFSLVLFAPIALLLGYISDIEMRRALSVAVSVVFLCVLSISLAALLIVVTCFSYLMIRIVVVRRATYWPAFLMLAAVLILFKFIAPVTLSFEFLSIRTIWLPLGLSYLLARHIDLAQKVSTHQIKKFSFFDFFEFSIYWPSSMAGPITELSEFTRGRNAFVAHGDRLLGLSRIGEGIVRKIAAEIIFAVVIVKYYDAVLVSTSASALLVLGYYFSNLIYVFLDFSGYTSIAIGSARLMGQKLPENFDRPLLQWNMRLFWRHWHMSLTRWVSRIVFIPLSMSVRRQTRWIQYCVPVLATTLSIGLWHSFQLSWFLWSIHHALGIIISDLLIKLEACTQNKNIPFLKFSLRSMGVLFVWFWLMLSYSFTLSSNPIISLNLYVDILLAPIQLLGYIFRI